MKDFFKLTKVKNWITIVLFLLIEYFFIYPASVLSGITFCKMVPGGSCPEPHFPWNVFVIASLISLLFCYLVSCLIFWIYSKLKK